MQGADYEAAREMLTYGNKAGLDLEDRQEIGEMVERLEG
jgi:hypothetical protein